MGRHGAAGIVEEEYDAQLDHCACQGCTCYCWMDDLWVRCAASIIAVLFAALGVFYAASQIILMSQ